MRWILACVPYCTPYCSHSQTLRGVYARGNERAYTMAPEGTPFRRIRIDDDLWKRLDDAAKQSDPDSNRSAVLRKFARWFVGDINEMPQRPEPQQGGR